ncbi:unnamed protein product [Brassica oleracea var. botrytis]
MTSTEFSFSVSLGFPRRPPSLESPAVTAVNHCTESSSRYLVFNSISTCVVWSPAELLQNG